MERKNEIVFVVLITIVIAAAILASFGPTLFSGGTPRVVLPEPSLPAETGAPEPGGIGGGFLPVGVTPDTVQNVIAALERPASYARTITLDTFSAGVQYTASARVWVDGDWTRVDMTQAVQPRGAQVTVVGGGVFYRWYGGDRMAVQGPADQWDADLAQRIPSYQDIVDLDKGTISDTDYVEKDGLPCIYVEVAVDGLGYAERYWVSVDEGSRGLLMASETLKNGAVVLRMSSSAPESPVPSDADFTLPDGTVLHQVGG